MSLDHPIVDPRTSYYHQGILMVPLGSIREGGVKILEGGVKFWKGGVKILEGGVKILEGGVKILEGGSNFWTGGGTPESPKKLKKSQIWGGYGHRPRNRPGPLRF
jgi:hypothetical protein